LSDNIRPIGCREVMDDFKSGAYRSKPCVQANCHRHKKEEG
jgi:hypothetical protein